MVGTSADTTATAFLVAVTLDIPPSDQVSHPPLWYLSIGHSKTPWGSSAMDRSSCILWFGHMRIVFFDHFSSQGSFQGHLSPLQSPQPHQAPSPKRSGIKHSHSWFPGLYKYLMDYNIGSAIFRSFRHETTSRLKTP